MKVWLDAQLPPDLCAWLESEFSLEATAIRSLGLHEAKDWAVFTEAREAGAVIGATLREALEIIEAGEPLVRLAETLPEAS